MPDFRQLTPEYRTKQRNELAKQFRGAKFGWPADATQQALAALQEALESSSEEAIQKVLTSNPYLIQYAIKNSGHHGIWVFPKQMIRQRGVDDIAGLIPDFLIVTRSSLGYFWHILEIKRFDIQFANGRCDGYSPEGNKAVAQCNAYLAQFQDYIDTVRTNIRVAELIQPVGEVLLIGDSEKESDSQRQCRSNFVRNNPRIDVVSYRRIIGGMESDLRSRGKM